MSNQEAKNAVAIATGTQFAVASVTTGFLFKTTKFFVCEKDDQGIFRAMFEADSKEEAIHNFVAFENSLELSGASLPF